MHIDYRRLADRRPLRPVGAIRMIRDLIGALLAAFFLALPFVLYFWSMKP